MNRIQIALDTAAGETITGVSSWNEALRHATQRMTETGITGFVDHGGHHWSAEAYTAMDIRTTVANTARAATWETNQDFGNDLYQVSYHNGARPKCYPWQNKVISSTDNARVTYDLDGNEITVYAQSETSYGEAAGLFGINCKHYPSSFIPGVSIIRGEPQSEEENAKTYAESQEQRRLERKLREEKRDLAMAKAQGAPEDEIKRLRNKTRKTSQDIEDFCEQTGRARHRDREAVYTKREFPDKNKYDVTKFEHEQQDTIKKYFENGGEQQGYTFGQMQPNEPIVPQTAPVAPVTPITEIPVTDQQAESVPAVTLSKRAQEADTLQMYGEAVQWAEDSYQAEMDDLREGWKSVQTQIDAFDEFDKNVPIWEKTIKDAVEKEDFAIRTSSGDTVRILEDGKFKSQIETGSTHGYLDIDKRKRATEQLFAYGEQITVADDQYEIYGYLGDAPRAGMYGNTRIVLKKGNLIDRTTVTVGDSLELIETGADPMATLATDPKIVSYGKVFSNSVPNAPQRLSDVQRDFDAIKNTGHLSDGNYIELQFHGGVTTEDIEYIQVSKQDTNAQRIADLAKEKGVTVKWE